MSTQPSATAANDAPPEPVAARLDARCAAHRRAGDRREIVAHTVATLLEVTERAGREGRFLDAAFATGVVRAAAEAYLAAEAAFDRHDGSCPWPWQRTFQTAVSRQGTVLEDVLRGLVVFVGHDLALATAAALATDHAASGRPGKRATAPPLAPVLARRRFDHDVVCDLFEAHLSALQVSARIRFSRQQHVLDRAARRLDPALVLPLFRRLRDQSWGWALAAAFAESLEDQARVRRQAASVTTAEVEQVDIVRHLPVPMLRPILWMFRPALG